MSPPRRTSPSKYTGPAKAEILCNIREFNDHHTPSKQLAMPAISQASRVKVEELEAKKKVEAERQKRRAMLQEQASGLINELCDVQGRAAKGDDANIDYEGVLGKCKSLMARLKGKKNSPPADQQESEPRGSSRGSKVALKQAIDHTIQGLETENLDDWEQHVKSLKTIRGSAMFSKPMNQAPSPEPKAIKLQKRILARHSPEKVSRPSTPDAGQHSQTLPQKTLKKSESWQNEVNDARFLEEVKKDWQEKQKQDALAKTKQWEAETKQAEAEHKATEGKEVGRKEAERLEALKKEKAKAERRAQNERQLEADRQLRKQQEADKKRKNEEKKREVSAMWKRSCEEAQQKKAAETAMIAKEQGQAKAKPNDKPVPKPRGRSPRRKPSPMTIARFADKSPERRPEDHAPPRVPQSGPREGSESPKKVGFSDSEDESSMPGRYPRSPERRLSQRRAKLPRRPDRVSKLPDKYFRTTEEEKEQLLKERQESAAQLHSEVRKYY